MPSILARMRCRLGVSEPLRRCGTNLVAMEAMACGVPTYVSYNTGQKGSEGHDLLGTAARLKTQKPVKATPASQTLQDWGESEVDEVVAAFEYVYTHRADAARDAAVVAEKIKGWDWGLQNRKLLLRNRMRPADGRPDHYHDASPLVIVGTPCFGGPRHPGLCNVASAAYGASPHRLGFDVAVVMLGNDALITRGRSAIVAKFLDNPATTHLLFIDADICFTPEHVLRLLRFDKDFVAGLYPAKIIDWQQSRTSVSRQHGRNPGRGPDFAYVGEIEARSVKRKTENGFAYRHSTPAPAFSLSSAVFSSA